MATDVRTTRQKVAIGEAFTKLDRPLSPEERLEYAQTTVPGISMATVYRNISTLVDEGWLVEVNLPGSSARYEVSGKKHHHHFQCGQCGKVYELGGCDIVSKPRLPKGFRLSGDEIFLYGTCSACA